MHQHRTCILEEATAIFNMKVHAYKGIAVSLHSYAYVSIKTQIQYIL